MGMSLDEGSGPRSDAKLTANCKLAAAGAETAKAKQKQAEEKAAKLAKAKANPDPPCAPSLCENRNALLLFRRFLPPTPTRLHTARCW